jgi:hypothetical protein
MTHFYWLRDREMKVKTVMLSFSDLALNDDTMLFHNFKFIATKKKRFLKIYLENIVQILFLLTSFFKLKFRHLSL